MKKKKFTVTIGIPAHNEESNIQYLLRSILKQKGDNFILSKIIIICDGCTDNTEKIVEKLVLNYPMIKLISDGARRGKVGCLNDLYKLNRSDILITFDADIILADENTITNLIQVFQGDYKAHCVACHQVPVKVETFMAKIFYASYKLWEEIRINVNDGDHIHNLQGSATGLTKKFTKSVVFPKGLTGDQVYLYYKAKQINGFRYARNAKILFRPVATFSDFVVQGGRSVFVDKQNLVDYFGQESYKLFAIPLRYKILGVTKSIISDPFYTSLGIILQVYLRLFPKVDEGSLTGKWTMVASTKKAIKV